jgi:thioredoxin
MRSRTRFFQRYFPTRAAIVATIAIVGGPVFATTSASETPAALLNVTTATFAREVIAESEVRPVLLDFYADWCGPCRSMEPMLRDLAGQYRGRLDIRRVNLDQEPELKTRYGVNSVPRLLLIEHGATIAELRGAPSELQFRRFLREYLVATL